MTTDAFLKCLGRHPSLRCEMRDFLQLAEAAADLTEAERRKLSKAVQEKLNVQPNMTTFEGGYNQFLELALLAVGPLGTVKKLRLHSELEPVTLKILCERKPDWLDKWLAGEFARDWSSMSWWFFRELLRSGVCSKPDSDDWLRYFAMSIGYRYARHIKPHLTRSELLRQDPEFLADVWRCFEVETAMFAALTESPFHRGVPDFEDWGLTLLRLCESGHLDRQRLLGATLRGLAADFSAQSLTGLTRFYDRLEPTAADLTNVQATLCELLTSRATHVVKFALDKLAIVQKEGQLDGAAFLAVSPAVFALKPKGQSQQVLAIAVKIAKDQPELLAEVANLAMDALSHESGDVQSAAVKLLESEQKRLHRDHGTELQSRLSGLSATVRPRVESLIAALGGGKVAEQETPAADDCSFDELRARAAAVPAEWRSLAGLDDALQCLDTDTLFPGIWFDVLFVPVLSSCAPITPIATVDELLDTVAHMLEKIESADQIERILDGISRLGDQRPADFEHRAAPLVKRLTSPATTTADFLNNQVIDLLTPLLLRWLGSPGAAVTPSFSNPFAPRVEDPRALPKFIKRRLREIETRLAVKRPQTLLAAPTHEHGWLNPRVFVERLQSLGETKPPPADLIQGLLRLAPDHRATALASAADLPSDWGGAVRFALGGPAPTAEVESEDEFSLWLTAGRARQPRNPLEELAIAAGPQRAALLVEPTFNWQVRDEDRSGRWYAGEKPLIELKAEPPLPRAETTALRPTLTVREENYNRWESFGAVWSQSWLSIVWPANLDHLQADSIYHLRQRIESPASSLEPNQLYFPPLLQPDLAWNELTRLALWIALTSKDAGSRGIALDVLITGVEDGRAELKCDELLKLATANWFKLNRVAEALREVARVSPRHAWWSAEFLQRFLGKLPNWPTEVHHLLTVLHELLAQLQLGVSDYCRDQIQAGATKGKGAKLQKEILNLQKSPHSSERQRAHELALTTCVARAERWASGSA